MTRSKRWMQIVGAIYVLNFVMINVVRAPIATLGPAGALSLAAAGDPMARFVVDSWFIWGLDVGVIGVALLVGARNAEQWRPLAFTVIALELVRGIFADVYMVARGYAVGPMVVWIAIHAAIIATGIACTRSAPLTARRAT